MGHLTALNRWETFWRKVDQARTIPRAFLLFYAYQMQQAFNWFTGLDDPSNAQSLFVGVVYAASAPIMKWYMDGGGMALPVVPMASTATSTVTTTPVKE